MQSKWANCEQTPDEAEDESSVFRIPATIHEGAKLASYRAGGLWVFFSFGGISSLHCRIRVCLLRKRNNLRKTSLPTFLSKSTRLFLSNSLALFFFLPLYYFKQKLSFQTSHSPATSNGRASIECIPPAARAHTHFPRHVSHLCSVWVGIAQSKGIKEPCSTNA